MRDAQHWTTTETNLADFGDMRLNKRYGDILLSFANFPSKSLPNSFKSWGETIAAYRFLNHENVTSTDILAPHKSATIERIKNEKIVLVPQDTTDVDFSGRKNITDMGYLGQESSLGFYLHPSIAITPERSCLGVIDMQTWTREEFGVRGKRKNKPIEQKESYCWIKGYEAANAVALLAPDTTIVSMADREGDIYELLEKMPSALNKAYWLVRCYHNRAIRNEEDDVVELRLWEAIKATKPIGEIEFDMSDGRIYNRNAGSRRPRTERTVRQEIRFSTFQIKPPRGKGKKSESISINVVHCVEIGAPSEDEKIEWYLLTSYPVNNAETAMQVVEWYLCRWQIEIFFKILKSGCAIEKLQFETMKATTNCVAFYLIVAWRILHLTMLGRNCPDLDCDLVFETNEWQSVYTITTRKKPPTTPPKLNLIIKMIAGLGGFLNRKADGHPGPKVMWMGIQRMRDFTLAWEVFRSPEETYV